MGSKRVSEIVDLLHLEPHPEGGYYAETFRDTSVTLKKSQLPSQYKVDRPISTNIYFLLPSGNISLIHRIPCAETWHFYMGDPLTVVELGDDGKVKFTVLGPDLASGQKLQYVVRPYVWFGSFPSKDIETFSSDGSSLLKAPRRDPELNFSLVGCTCSPAFQFDDFELAKQSHLLSFAPNARPFIEYLAIAD
ncbi:hypothetical protein AMTRI_Chr12g233940 [Amborella trichopoda]